jgi:hypothetical protein
MARLRPSQCRGVTDFGDAHCWRAHTVVGVWTWTLWAIRVRQRGVGNIGARGLTCSWRVELATVESWT